jgi:argininosuccinate synthase
MTERIVLAYTGSLKTSVAIRSLAETDDAEVVTLTLDLGQRCDLEEVRDRALATGAARAHVLDVRDEFAHDFVLPALQAGALHEGRDPMGAALALPLIARKLIEMASIEQATAIAHGCTGVDRERMDYHVRALDPDIRVIGVGDAVVVHCTHANLWGRVYRFARSQDLSPRSQLPAETPDIPAYMEIAFQRGVPVAINGVEMPLTELIESLSIIAGQYGVGRIEEEKSNVTGAQIHHVHEAPAAVVLHAALAALEASVLPPDLLQLKRGRATEYARIVSDGLWFAAARGTLDALNAKVQESVTGSVSIKLFKKTLLASVTAELAHATVPRT